MDFTLPVSPKPEAGASFIEVRVEGDGPDNYLCGNCGAIVCKNITKGHVTEFIHSAGEKGMFIKCRNCGSYHALTQFESQF